MSERLNSDSNLPIRERLGLRPIINASGTMTALGASIMVPEAIKAMAEIATEFVEMDDLQRAASRTIMVRGHQAEQGRFWLDPCNLHPGEAETVAERLAAIVSGDRPAGAMATPVKSAAGALRWPD